MSFYQNLRVIINILECTNKELSEASNIDQTIISKFKNNFRIPTIGTKPFISLINGICTIAIKKNKTKQINDLCGNNNDLYTNIHNYIVNNSNDIRYNKNDDSLIGTNLERLMKSFNITNVMLAKHLNIDGSIISKYKTGKRFILKNDTLVNQICDYFENFIIKNELIDEACELFNINNTQNLFEIINTYLFDNKNKDSQINRLLESINSFIFEIPQNIPLLETIVPKEIFDNKKDHYIGVNEFRNSIKRFLGSVCLNETPTTMYLYSDENLKWLIQDKEFYNTWKILMTTCLVKKNKIKIIHNINRNSEEMFKAIESWLPLYITGQIEPYYNIKNSNSFTHTLFIADNVSVVSSSSIISNTDYNIYNYSENKEIINNYKDQYLVLLKRLNPLVRIYLEDSNLINKNDYIEYRKKDFNNIIILLKKDDSEVLVIKNNSLRIIFQFTCPIMVDVFKKYIKK